MIPYFSNPAVEMTNGPIMERLDVEERGSFRRSKMRSILTKTGYLYSRNSPNLTKLVWLAMC
jgi:hypothetical protein